MLADVWGIAARGLHIVCWLMCGELLCSDSGITVSLINYCSNTSASHCEE
jgi:hypothetical protein